MTTNRSSTLAGPGKSEQDKKRADKQQILPTSLCNYEPFDLPTDIEIDLWQNWKEFKQVAKHTQTQSDRVIVLQKAVSASVDKHNKIISGMVFGMLLANIEKTQMAPQTLFVDLSSIIRYNYEIVIQVLYALVDQCYDYFKESTLTQMLWLGELLIQKAVPNLKNLFLLLARQLNPNRADSKSASLNKQLVDIFNRNIEWTLSQPIFGNVILLKLLRQAEEHFSQVELVELRETELKICVKIWQSKKEECFEIGKELLRVLGNVSKLKQLKPLFEDLDQDIEGKPLFIHLQEKKGFKAGQRNMYLQHLVTPTIEKKLDFLLTNVPQEGYSMYMKWFQDSIRLEYGSESESQIVDIVRHIVVNIRPPIDIIHSKILQRYVLIGVFITSQKHEIHQSLVLQALFMDWLFYDEKSPDSIMLVEPGMLLIYKSADKYPHLTEKLVEFLDAYVKNYDQERVDEFMLSVQRVMIDCERKRVIQSVKHLINHPALNPDIQSRLKGLYRADQIIKEQRSRQMQSTTQSFESYYNQLSDPYARSSAPFDDDLLGNDFSPPYEPVEKGEAQETEDFTRMTSPQYEQEDMATSEAGEDIDYRSHESMSTENDAYLHASTFQGAQPYNIDLYSAEFDQTKEEAKQAQTGLKKKQTGKEKHKKVAADGSSESVSSSSSQSLSNESSDEESEMSISDQETQKEPNTKQYTSNIKIQVPAHVIQKYLTQEVLDAYLENPSSANLKTLLDDLCNKVSAQEPQIQSKEDQAKQRKELTEVAFIIYESLKVELSRSDLNSLAKKWQSQTILAMFNYLIGNSTPGKLQSFKAVSYLIAGIQQFDEFLEGKLLLHIILQCQKQKNLAKAYTQIIINYVTYRRQEAPVASDAGTTAQLKQFVNECLEKMVGTMQVKALNQLFLTFLPQLFNRACLDNEEFTKVLLQVATPETLRKITMSIQSGQYQLVQSQIMTVIQLIFKGTKPLPYLSQQHLWQIVNAHSFNQFKTPDNLVKVVTYTIRSNLNRLRYDKNISGALSATFVGFSSFIRLYFLQAKTQQEFGNEIKSLLEFMQDFVDDKLIQKEIKSIIEVAFKQLSESQCENEMNKVLQDYKENSRLPDNIGAAKALAEVIKSNNNSLQAIVDESKHTGLLLKGMLADLNQ